MASKNKGDWTTLSADISLPTDFAAAIMTARPELARRINRLMTAEETSQVAHALAVLIETNAGLQERVSRLATRLEQIASQASAIGTSLETAVEYLETGDEDLLSRRAANRRLVEQES